MGLGFMFQGHHQVALYGFKSYCYLSEYDTYWIYETAGNLICLLSLCKKKKRLQLLAFRGVQSVSFMIILS